MDTKIEELKALKKQVEDLQVQVHKKLKPVFDEGAKALFADNPTLVDFSWTQYTPYFNDGDSCVFSSNHEYADINGNEEGYYDEDQDEELPEQDEVNVVAKYPTLNKKELKALADKVHEFLATFDDNDMEVMFGDHVQVTVTKNGAEVEDYEHD